MVLAGTTPSEAQSPASLPDSPSQTAPEYATTAEVALLRNDLQQVQVQLASLQQAAQAPNQPAPRGPNMHAPTVEPPTRHSTPVIPSPSYSPTRSQSYSITRSTSPFTTRRSRSRSPISHWRVQQRTYRLTSLPTAYTPADSMTSRRAFFWQPQVPRSPNAPFPTLITRWTPGELLIISRETRRMAVHQALDFARSYSLDFGRLIRRLRTSFRGQSYVGAWWWQQELCRQFRPGIYH